jgi:excinuclease ABC subunit C
MITKKQLASLPSTFGIYIFKKGKDILYVGKSINIKARVASHIENAKLDRKEFLIVSGSDNLETRQTENEFAALILESELIKKFHPKYNVIWRDNKSYLYVKITTKDEFPKVLLSRKEDDGKSLYFGPFSGSRLVSDLIADLRKIVPFCTQKSLSRRACFYSKIGLCDPCPGSIVKTKDKEEYLRLKKIYRKNINRVVGIFRGKVQTLLSTFYKDLRRLTKEERFEEAIKVRNKIFRLERLVHYPLWSPQTTSSELGDYKSSLLKILGPYFPDLRDLSRIETYDVSNLGEKNQTASMVVSVRGIIDKSQYKRFKIKQKRLQSDFERLEEVIKRRFRQNWPKPNILLVDGGVPQVAKVIETLRTLKLSIPVVGIAKNPDRLVVGVAGMPTVRPPMRSPGFNLVRALRDESHRFARKYHLFLRERDFLI